MEIRTLTMNNYNEMIQLWLRSDLPIKIKGRDSRAAIESQMKSNPDFFIGAFENSCLIGVVVASSDGRKGWINRLAVDPDYRQKKIGRTLVAEAENVLRKQGIKFYAALIENSNNASKSLFKKCGYVKHQNVSYFSKRNSNEV